MSVRDRAHPVGALQDFLQARRAEAPAITGLVVALSGGPDSLTLLLAAAQTAHDLGYRLRALHVHHGLHDDADRWAAQAQAQAAALAVPCDVLPVVVPSVASVEAAARAARYAALAAALAPDEALLLAHHQDDQAETLLLRLLRGAGLQGVAGMRPVSFWRTDAGPVMARWRPWLTLPRAALARWRPRAVACLAARGVSMPESVQDPANADPRFDRSWLREHLLPRLTERWPQVAAQFARSAQQLSGQARALDRLADAWCRDRQLPDTSLPLPDLQALDDDTLQAVVARWLATRGAPPLPVRHWPRLRRELLLARPDAQPVLAWAGWSLRRYRLTLHLLADTDWPPLPASGQDWPDPRQPLVWAGRRWQVTGLSPDDPRLAGCWRLAPRRGGERWRPPGQRHRVSLKQWCQTQGLPPWQRAQLACLWVDDELVAHSGAAGEGVALTSQPVAAPG